MNSNPGLKLYKIFDTKTKLYSCGGLTPKWSKKGGKVWVGESTVRSHIRKHFPLGLPVEWEIIQYEAHQSNKISIEDYMLGNRFEA